MQKPKLAVIGTVGLPGKYGGFETLTDHLVEELSREIDFTVYCSKKKYKPAQRLKRYKGAKLFFLPFDANGIQSIFYDTVSILHAMFYADVMLVLGVSGGFMLPFVKLFTNKKIIVSIDGIEWKRNKWSKIAKWYLFAAEWCAVKFSHANITDNESIQDYTAIRYKKLSSLIEYGADHTIKLRPSETDKVKYPFLKNPYAFNVCRIEPENNVHIMLEAFKNQPKRILVVVGNWGNSKYGIDLKIKYGNCDNLHLLDPIYEQQELDVLRGNCYVYIHAHSAGGTNPSLVEAMHLGLCVIAFNVSYNKTTTEQRAFYFNDAQQLTDIISTKNFREIKEQGEVMKSIAVRRYTWQVIGLKYHRLINKTLSESMHQRLLSKASSVLSNENFLELELAHFQSPKLFYEKN